MTTEPSGESVQLVQLEPQPTAIIRTTIEPNDMIELEPVWLTKLGQFMQARGITPTGPSFHRYHTFSHEITDMECGYPIAAFVEGEGDITGSELPGGPAATVWHLGHYQTLGETYGRLESFISEKGFESDGGTWEVYWAGPGDNPDDPTTWRTQLVQPIKK